MEGHRQSLEYSEQQLGLARSHLELREKQLALVVSRLEEQVCNGV